MGKFIKKLETKNYLIGSFDTYLELSKSLIMKNSELTNEEADNVISSMPTTFRASIEDKDGNFLGYIGVFDIDMENNSASIRCEVNERFNEAKKNEIIDEFELYLYESLNISNITMTIFKDSVKSETLKNEKVKRGNIILPNKMLIEGVLPSTREKFIDQIDASKLTKPYTITSSGRVIGVIGLTNVLQANRRASLNIVIDRSLGTDIINELANHLIDDYIKYIHRFNIHNINTIVDGSDDLLKEIVQNTKMNFYADIPFSSVNNEQINSSFMYQSTPKSEKEDIIIPKNNFIYSNNVSADKIPFRDNIVLARSIVLVSPKMCSENIFKKCFIDHIEAMQNRKDFSIPLGEDKYFLQEGNANYGLFKTFYNYDYIAYDDKGNYIGYVNRLRSNANNKNAEVEIGIAPSFQGTGYGLLIMDAFYEELFRVGYLSITSNVFSFNNKSLYLHDKIATYNGKRIESYYINGKLWDMVSYTKVNEDKSIKTLIKN